MSQTVDIPDPNFEQALIDLGFDTNGLNGNILVANALGTSLLNLNNKNISSLQGIEAFENLTSLNCNGNNLSSIDLSSNLNLVALQCTDNQITVLNLQNNTSLEQLHCSNNLLTNLDVSANTALTTISCPFNSITSLDFSNNLDLEYLVAVHNDLTTINVTNNSLLNTLYLDDNDLSSLDVSNNGLLEYLYLKDNHLTTLNLANNTLLKNLRINNNNFNSIDISSNTLLETFTSTNNNISSIDISNNIQLKVLGLALNNLTTIDASNNSMLTEFRASNNQLVSVNLKNGNNTNIASNKFSTQSNPNLLCVEVDDEAYSNSNWSSSIDAQTSFSESCPTIAIPDANFEQALIDLGYDLNGLTGDILEGEAAMVTYLDVSNKNINSLQGIEGFVNLTDLRCQENNLISLDVSNNLSLVQLNCRTNQLTSLDVTNNTALEILNCFSNQINGLDLSNNPVLRSILCDDNQLESLNVKNGNNENVTLFGALNNPNLLCIEVDNLAYSNTNWSSGIDAQTSFSEDCDGTLSIEEVSVLDNVKLFPNPSSGQFSINGLQQDSKVKVYDINSRLILSKTVSNNETINLANTTAGIYFINISNQAGSTVKKLVIQ
ncbi:T9SS type A sorting domain-containing protein [Neotamlana sedimentorum]|uniref:T9SS type A sorting domain-containing protein n=1 Tax=Neotamlana sedimentorum TaxID=1435349 RepID=UPI00069A3D10|nr:T9SS type A sorting domain-containing protein [Tamlana sedimentorum]